CQALLVDPLEQCPFRVQRSTAHTIAVVVGLAVLAGGCGAFHSEPAVRRHAGLDVLLITIDTLRADAIGAYGNSRASTPSIDRLAAAGVRFADEIGRAHV